MQKRIQQWIISHIDTFFNKGDTKQALKPGYHPKENDDDDDEGFGDNGMPANVLIAHPGQFEWVVCGVCFKVTNPESWWKHHRNCKNRVCRDAGIARALGEVKTREAKKKQLATKVAFAHLRKCAFGDIT